MRDDSCVTVTLVVWEMLDMVVYDLRTGTPVYTTKWCTIWTPESWSTQHTSSVSLPPSLATLVLSNNSVLDYYCWHEERSGDDIATDLEDNIAALEYYGLPFNLK